MTATEIDTVTAPATAGVVPRRGGAGRRLLRKPLGVFALVVLAVLIALGLLEPLLTDYDPGLADLQSVNAGVGSAGHVLGTDQFGRDMWSRILSSIEVSLVSAIIGAGVAAVLGTVLGLIAGYIGKRTDSVLSWVFELLMTFPALILVIVLNPVTGGSYQIMMAIFGVFLSTGVFRLVRNLVVGVRNELYVDAARVSGLSNRRILSRHVLYIVRGPIIITSAFLASAAIGVQAGLAFLGIGSSQQVSFGSMTSDAFANVYVEPVQMVWPALFLALLTGSLVLLGNAYRDALAAPTGTAGTRKRSRRPAAASPAAAGDLVPADAAPADADAAATPASATPAAAATAGATSSGSALLTVRNLHVGYAQVDGTVRDVVKGVSLDVSAGEIVGLVGESGSGKTQTAFAVLQLLPHEARVSADVLSVDGRDLQRASAADLRKLRGPVMAYIPQEPMANLDPSFTVGSQLVEGLRDMPRGEAEKTVLELLDRVGITDPRRTFKSYPHQISGGMAQRVLIAGAVAPRPKLLIADEPTTALDVTVQAEILDLLRDLQTEFHMGVLLVTHNFGVVADLCDRVLVMQEGELVEGGDVRSIFHSPTHPYTQQLIGAILDEETVRTDPAPTTAPSTAGGATAAVLIEEAR
jgi:peptide/nickel transport system permease protein